MPLPLTLPFTLSAASIDKVYPSKVESIAGGGGQDDLDQTATDPNRNYIACKGIAFEANDNIRVQCDPNDNIEFIDPNSGTIKLNVLAAKVSADGSIDTHSDVDTATTPPTLNQLLKWNGSNWVPGTSSGAPVDSVNGETGVVVLDTDDISEGTTNLYYTEARVTANTSVTANTAKVSADGSINTHSDVDTTTTAPVTNQALRWNGSNWVPTDINPIPLIIALG